MQEAFRKDINGLRAVAVSIVMLYHFRVPGFGAGYAGVDAFFVISGYLMTRVITERLEANRFSLAGFYRDRARRILPALIVLVAALLAAGWWLADPLAYLVLGRNAAAAAFFVSDMLFASETGYFARAQETNWLLHTWSLSVECQFYAVYPLVLLVAKRAGLLRGRGLFLLPLILASLALAVAAPSFGGRAQTIAFFVLPARAWELLAGGLVYNLERTLAVGRHGRLLEAAGLALLVATLLLFDRYTAWPSYRALVPVTAAALLILARRPNDASLLRFAPLQRLGDWSYSIYLWHLPAGVVLAMADARDDAAFVALAIAASLALGFLSFRFVERPGRRLFDCAGEPRRALAAGTLAAASVAAIGATVFAGDGIPRRAAGDPSVIADAIAATRELGAFASCQGMEAGRLSVCWSRSEREPGIAVFGDSQAQMWRPRYAASPDNVVFLTNNGCPIFPGAVRKDRPDCRGWRDAAVALVAGDRVTTVVYAGFWTQLVATDGRRNVLCVEISTRCVPANSAETVEALLAGLGAEVARLQAAGKRVAVVLPFPAPLVEDVPRKVIDAAFRGGRPDFPMEDLARRPEVEMLIRRGLARLAGQGVTIIDPWPLLCRDGRCPFVDAAGRPLWLDNIHLRPGAVARLPLLDGLMAPSPGVLAE